MVIIRRAIKTATQSGRGKCDKWRIFFPPPGAGFCDPLMGWETQQDMYQELFLTFDKFEDAIAYARENNLNFTVEESPPIAPLKPHTYAEHLLKGHLR
jgi:hypothetical protein